jgi:hypothetical protein
LRSRRRGKGVVSTNASVGPPTRLPVVLLQLEAAVARLLIHGPAYHEFADRRTWMGFRNPTNVLRTRPDDVSNLREGWPVIGCISRSPPTDFIGQSRTARRRPSARKRVRHEIRPSDLDLQELWSVEQDSGRAGWHREVRPLRRRHEDSTQSHPGRRNSRPVIPIRPPERALAPAQARTSQACPPPSRQRLPACPCHTSC